jgi:hypothetical protein
MDVELWYVLQLSDDSDSFFFLEQRLVGSNKFYLDLLGEGLKVKSSVLRKTLDVLSIQELNLSHSGLEPGLFEVILVLI